MKVQIQPSFGFPASELHGIAWITIVLSNGDMFKVSEVVPPGSLRITPLKPRDNALLAQGV